MDDLVAPIARSQHGLITRSQALDAGLTARMVAYRVQQGRWLAAAPRVYRINGSPLSWQGRTLAQCLSAGPDAVVSHRSAAAIWDLEGFGPPGRVELTTPRHRRHVRVVARVHESIDFDHIGLVRRHRVPVTGAARTVLDLCAVLDDELAMLRALDDVRRRRLATWPELWECLVLHARRGRTGVAPFRRILEERWGKRPPYRHFARLVMRLLTDAGLPEPEAEHEVIVAGAGYRIDLAYPELKIAIECNGKDHLTDRAFEHDPVRRDRLELAGWLVLDYTWRRLIDEPYAIVAEICAAIALRRSGAGN